MSKDENKVISTIQMLSKILKYAYIGITVNKEHDCNNCKNGGCRYSGNSVKKVWENTWQYQRIMEILDDYWLTQPDEAKVVVQMHFTHLNGEEQDKYIVWSNPQK